MSVVVRMTLSDWLKLCSTLGIVGIISSMEKEFSQRFNCKTNFILVLGNTWLEDDENKTESVMDITFVDTDTAVWFRLKYL